MKKILILDIGTNSIKYLTAVQQKHGQLSIHEENLIQTRLGEGLAANQTINPRAFRRTAAAINQLISHNQPDRIIAVATMALRQAENLTDILKKFDRQYGIKINIISGDEEARLSFLAAKRMLQINATNTVIFDSGGGSTELILAHNDTLKYHNSYGVGAVTLTEQWLTSSPVSEDEILAAIKTIRATFTDKNLNSDNPVIIGSGGTATTLASMKLRLKSFDSKKINRASISRSELDAMIDELAVKKLNQRKKMPGLDPQRADIILAGALIVNEILDIFKGDHFYTITSGIRHGILHEHFFDNNLT